MFKMLLFILLLVLVAGAWLLRGVVGRRRWRHRYERALDALSRDVHRLEQQLLATQGFHVGRSESQTAAFAFDAPALLARDRATGGFYAIVQLAARTSDQLHKPSMPASDGMPTQPVSAILEWQNGVWSVAPRPLLQGRPRDVLLQHARQLDLVREVALG